jgi:hypothetical protein
MTAEYPMFSNRVQSSMGDKDCYYQVYLIVSPSFVALDPRPCRNKPFFSVMDYCVHIFLFTKETAANGNTFYMLSSIGLLR